MDAIEKRGSPPRRRDEHLDRIVERKPSYVLYRNSRGSTKSTSSTCPRRRACQRQVRAGGRIKGARKIPSRRGRVAARRKKSIVFFRASFSGSGSSRIYLLTVPWERSERFGERHRYERVRRPDQGRQARRVRRISGPRARKSGGTVAGVRPHFHAAGSGRAAPVAPHQRPRCAIHAAVFRVPDGSGDLRGLARVRQPQAGIPGPGDFRSCSRPRCVTRVPPGRTWWRCVFSEVGWRSLSRGLFAVWMTAGLMPAQVDSTGSNSFGIVFGVPNCCSDDPKGSLTLPYAGNDAARVRNFFRQRLRAPAANLLPSGSADPDEISMRRALEIAFHQAAASNVDLCLRVRSRLRLFRGRSVGRLHRAEERHARRRLQFAQDKLPHLHTVKVHSSLRLPRGAAPGCVATGHGRRQFHQSTVERGDRRVESSRQTPEPGHRCTGHQSEREVIRQEGSWAHLHTT